MSLVTLASSWLPSWPTDTGDAATWAGAIFSLLTGAVAVVIAAQLSNRERRLALVQLHQDLTSSEIATARNTMGTLLYSEPDLAPTRLDAIEAYFRLIWALQRARNVFRIHEMYWQSLTGPATRSERLRHGRRHKEATLALTWNLNEIAENVVRFHDAYGDDWQISDRDAWKDVAKFVDVDEIRYRLVDAQSQVS